MHRLELTKPDGRALILYGRTALDPKTEAPAAGLVSERRSQLRWHPLRGEWVVYASHRQHRTFLPPPEWNPLGPTIDPAQPTEVPAGAWDVAVFENLFSALGSSGPPPPPDIVEIQPSGGTTEVVVFTQDTKGSLGALSLDHIELICSVWADRTRVLGGRDDVAYVLPFENRGVEVGVTLHHPHGQIYAYPFVPPVAARQLELQRHHHEKTGVSLLGELIAAEREADRRVLYDGQHAIAWVPVCARWSYEIWLAPLRPVALLDELASDERRDFARALQIALRKLDRLWDRPMPYVLALYQAPSRGGHPYAHMHIEILPWLRMPNRMKFMAGSEVGGGTFTADTLPEDKAAELRAVDIEHE